MASHAIFLDASCDERRNGWGSVRPARASPLCCACSHDLAATQTCTCVLLVPSQSTSHISVLLPRRLTTAVGAEAHALTCAWTVKETTPPLLASLFQCDVSSLIDCTVLVTAITTTASKSRPTRHVARSSPRRGLPPYPPPSSPASLRPLYQRPALSF